MARIAINGFGRIGRVAYRVMLERGLNKSIVAVNDLTDAPSLAHLLTYDTNYGVLKQKVTAQTYHNMPPYSGALVCGDHAFYVIAEKDPARLPWAQLGVDVVIESTGRFTTKEDMAKHLMAGAKKVILSAPADGEGVQTIVEGVNDQLLTAEDNLVANASCTTNCITPVAQVMLTKFGIEKAMMTTIHAYTSTQKVQDGPDKDLRRARSAAENIIPTSTGAAKATSAVIPELAGLFDGLAIRIPIKVGSLADFTFLLKRSTTVQEVNLALTEASKSERYKGILTVTNDPIVSSDIVGNPASSIVDLQLTQVVGGNMVKVVAWYDNEWGYANRLVEQALKLAGA